MGVELFARAAIWGVYGIYFFGLFPQVLLNYRLKSARGISDLMLFGYFAAYVTQFYFVFSGSFPPVYKIMVPLGTLAVLVLILQRFYYDKASIPHSIKLLYSVFFVSILVFTPIFFGGLATKIPFGWISASIWAVYQIPQVFKIYREKSFNGISFKFFSIMAVGVFIEFISGLILALPVQAILGNVRALLVYAVFYLQFSWYGR